MKPRFINGNSLQLLTNSAAYFLALEQAIDAARNVVSLETYIFADDETGRRMAAALARAAKRGVTVRVLVDGFGSNKIFDEIRQQLLANSGAGADLPPEDISLHSAAKPAAATAP